MLTGQMGESVGVTLIIDSDFNSVVGNTVAGKQRFGKELCLDLAAALHTSEDRFVVHELSAGSVRACVNIIPDPAGIDSRSAKALAMMLKDQSLDSSSMLRFASTTQGLRHVTLGQPFHGPSRDEQTPGTTFRTTFPPRKTHNSCLCAVRSACRTRALYLLTAGQ